MMQLRDDYKDIVIVDEKGGIEYFNIGYLDFFDLTPQELIGKKIPQLYANLDEDSSTLARAVNRGEEALGCVQELVTSRGRIVRQESDTMCIRNGDKVVGAIEFDYFDEQKDVIDNDAHGNDGSGQPSQITPEDIIGQCPQLKSVKKRLEKIMNLESPVLLAGESGTGKEMTARAIHHGSRRCNHDFVYVNCGALPQNLLEGILFGTRKGSFTDAKEKDGLFKMAHKGTLFLDEIDSMPLAIQGKLLKAIEEKRIRPVGAQEEIPVDVRIISSCNQRIAALMNGEQLRRDLYFRLSVIQLELAPLRERTSDPLLLADYYIQHFNERFSRGIKGLDQEAQQFFLSYSWPGNIRELKNMIEYAFHDTAATYISYESIRERMKLDPAAEVDAGSQAEAFFESGLGLKGYLEGLEKETVAKYLSHNGGDLKGTAADLGISQQVLQYKIAKYK